MLLDDIYIYKIFQGEKKCLIGMENFWNDIKNNNNVYDISKFGHGPKKRQLGLV